MNTGIVYVLTNPSFPDLVKIGFTGREDREIRERRTELFSTGVPEPFDLQIACRVDNAREVERALHIAFGPYRRSSRREFFEIRPEQAIAILRLLEVENDLTNEVAANPSMIRENIIRRAPRPQFDFEVLAIPLGSELLCPRVSAIVTVAGRRKVFLGEEKMFLTEATRRVLPGFADGNPCPYWRYEASTIQELYDAAYPRL